MIDLCHEAVIRRGNEEPCDREAVTYRLDPRPEFWNEREYPVCRRHAGPSVLSVLFQQDPTLTDLRQAGALLAGAAVMGA